MCLIAERIILQLQSGHVHGGPLRRTSEKMCGAAKEREQEKDFRACLYVGMRVSLLK